MRSLRVSKLTLVAMLIVGSVVGSAAIAGAGGAVTFTFDPDPPRAGDTVSITVTGSWPECNNQELAPSYIIIDVPDGEDIEGSFPGGNTTGTVDIPADLEPGTYDMQIQCSFSVGNSTFFPDLQIDILAALPTTTTSESTPTSSTGPSTTTSGVAAATAPRFTG